MVLFDSIQKGIPKNDPVAKLVFELSKLPGIGEKTATRLAYTILKKDQTYAQQLSQAILNAKSKIQFCDTCLTFTSESRCHICQDSERNHKIICVVEKPSDVHPIEDTHGYKGCYHILHGVLSPLDGIGPNDIKINELIKRIESEQLSNAPVNELILAMNPTVEGDATALYIAKIVKPFEIKVTKLALGIPVGGQLEYSDRQTIHVAMQNRVEMSH